MWDAGTGQLLSQYMEHQKRAWSVHISLSDPKMFASGSDDCSVKVWNINEACFLLCILIANHYYYTWYLYYLKLYSVIFFIFFCPFPGILNKINM